MRVRTVEVRRRRRPLPQAVAIFGPVVRDDASRLDARVCDDRIRPVLARLGLDE